MAALAGCKAKPTKAECGKLLDHVMAIEFQGAEAETAAKVKADVKKGFMSECVDNMPKHKVTCALKATDKAGLTNCDLTKKELAAAAKAAAAAPPPPPPEPEPEPEAAAAPDAGPAPDAG